MQARRLPPQSSGRILLAKLAAAITFPVRQYHDLLRLVLEEGQPRDNRTGTGTLSIFGARGRFRFASERARIPDA